MWNQYYTPTTLDDALALLAKHGSRARVVAGGTDLLPEIEQGRRRVDVLIDITRIAGLDRIWYDRATDTVHLGPAVTHNHVVASSLLVEQAYPLAQACWSVGSPQLRNRATVAGNLITASPANDTITPLRALDGQVTLARAGGGTRVLPLETFLQGVRQTALASDELVSDISFRPLANNERGMFLKLGLRRALTIAVVNVAVVLALDDDIVSRARVALGSVAPTIVRAPQAEAALTGQALEEPTIRRASALAAGACQPIDDVRGSASYRRSMVAVLVARALRMLRDGTERSLWPQHPLPLLWGQTDGHFQPAYGGTLRHGLDDRKPIEALINGRPYSIGSAKGKTLLRMLRENAGLTGTKDGCSEGDCGSCTVLLDGIAVLSCLVPAARAHGSEIVTVEGIGRNGALTPLQQAFVDCGAVQCGYCTPGAVVAGEALLAEEAQPSRQMIRQALAGNLCRCTGYYKMVEAIEAAAQRSAALRRKRHA